MNDVVTSKLERLCADFKDLKGRPFTYFYCPILFRDENTILCKAHIVNLAYRNSPKDWTIQRKDVDNFYGSHFESEFITLQYKTENWSPGDVIADKKLSKQFKPKILVGNKTVDYFAAESNTPANYTRIQIEDENQQNNIQLILKIHPDDMPNVIEQNWEIEINKDVRLSSLVSLIKAAHLTLFEMLGYRYALSAGGYFVGRQILGEFFLNNSSQTSKATIIRNAQVFFSEFAHMVRPVLSSEMNIKETISDNQLFACQESDGTIWSLIVFIRTSQQLHSIMIPVFDRPSAVVKFTDFLKNKNEIIEVRQCRFEATNGQWSMGKKSFQLTWPKSGVFDL